MNISVGRHSLSEKKLNSKLRGVLVPFPTPFDDGGELDARALRENIVRWNETGVCGYVALGSTGERVHLDERECLIVIETAREVVPESMAFVAGVGEQSTRGTIRDATRAARAGADAVLVITPHFYRGRMTNAALFDHFTAIADSSHVPVILYNIPQNTGVALAPEIIARLREHENIIGIKDSSGDMPALAETLRLAGDAPESFRIMTGHGGVLYPSLCAGVGGAILAAACVAPALCVEIFDAVEAGEHARARDLQARLSPIARAVTTVYGIGGLKAALDALGYRGGAVRAPLDAPDEAARAVIALLLSNLGERSGDEGRSVTDTRERLVGA